MERYLKKRKRCAKVGVVFYERGIFMELLKQIFPFSFQEKKDVVALVINVLIHILVGAVVGVVFGLLGKIPFLGILFGIVGSVAGLYLFVGLVLSVLDYFKVLK